MLRKVPFPVKREKLRRDDGRVTHQRMRPKEGAPPTAEERNHMANVAAMPCLVGKGCSGRITVHHVSSDGLKRIARSHQRVTPLCEGHHQIQHGPHDSVEAIGHGGFLAVHGVDLLAEAERLWEEREARR